MAATGASSPTPDVPARLVLLDAPPSAARALATVWPGVIIRPAANWEPAALLDPPPSPQDVFVLWTNDPARVDVARVAALHAAHPRVPLVARLRQGEAEAEIRLLAAGVQEFLPGSQGFPRALERARSRTALLVESRRTAADTPGTPAEETLFPNLYDWIYVVGVGEDGRMTFETVSPPLHAASDFLDPAFAGRTPEECLAPASAALMRGHLQQVQAEGRPLQFDEEHAVGGRTRNFQTTLTPVRNKWGRIHRVAGISRDTTVLREAQAALRASEERLAHALEGTQQGLWDWDLVRGVFYRSPRWFEMLGLADGEIEETLEAGLARVHPDDRAGVEKAVHLHLDGHLPRFVAEYRVQTGTGEWLWLFDAGKIVRWTPDGQPARIAGLCTDITERRRAEESLRALVGGVVHEMRNPAFGIGVNLDALEATFGDDARFRPFVAALRESCNRITSLMNDLRDYGEPRSLRAEPCRVRSLLDEAARSCEALARERGCTLHIDFEDPELVLPLHPLRMHQVFRNLLENALLHSPAGGEVHVTSRARDRQGQAWAVFTVTDRGPGFDAESLARAFEPFFTRRRGGTGLGLSIVRRVVEEHGGTVDAGNRDEGGAVLTLRLPMPRPRPPLTEPARG